MSHSIEPVRLEELERLETVVRRYRSVGILRVADELGWPSIKVLKVASASSQIRVPRQGRVKVQVLDWVGEGGIIPGGITESVDFPTSAESELLKHIIGLAADNLQEIYIDRITELAFEIWLGLPRKLQTWDMLVDICIMYINRKTIHELSHVLGSCNENAACFTETIIPVLGTSIIIENPKLPIIDLSIALKKQRSWTPEEIKLLRENYQQMRYRVAALFPDRTKKAVIRQIENQGLTLQKSQLTQVAQEKPVTRLEFKIASKRELVGIVFFGDIHIGAPNNICNLTYAQKMVHNILAGGKQKIPTYVILMGDYVDNVKMLGTLSRGPSPFEASMNPQKQYETALELLRPLAEKKRIIGLHEGNHDAWTKQLTGIDVASNLARELEVPLLGPGCTTRIVVNKQVYIIYSFHGVGSSKYSGSKLNALMNSVRAIDADVYAMGHVHSMAATPVTQRTREGKMQKRYYLLTGSYLEWDGSYAQNYSYSPEKIGSPWLILNARRWDMHLII